jgi:serine/arginine repetitive matrix protein 2
MRPKRDHPNLNTVLSSESSLRPVSLTSTDFRALSGSSTASVRWDERGLETVREQWKKEREVKRQNEEKADRRSSKESQQPAATLKKARLRPLSEQLLGRSWLRPMQDDD